jgi:hypothetical protein
MLTNDRRRGTGEVVDRIGLTQSETRSRGAEFEASVIQQVHDVDFGSRDETLHAQDLVAGLDRAV